MAKKLDQPELFINRELSWLEFNERVLQQGLNSQLPPFERLKFLAIVSSNLDEFFMIRVAGLQQQCAAQVRKRDISGLTPNQQLTEIHQRVHIMVEKQTQAISDLLDELVHQSLSILDPSQWTPRQHRFIRTYFTNEILPILTPLAMCELDPCPLLPGLQLHVGLLFRVTKDNSPDKRIIAVPIPNSCSRFVTLPGETGLQLAKIEDIIIDSAETFCTDGKLVASAAFRVTRDADVEIQEDEAADLLQTIDKAVIDRRRRAAVRLEITTQTETGLKQWLTKTLDLKNNQVYEIPGLIDAKSLMEIVAKPGFDSLKVPDWPPQPAKDLIGSEDLWQTLQDRDVLLSHPYESFDPVVQMVAQAAQDRNVLAIKQTLYRTSGDSPIIRALEQAANNGIAVTVLVELKARFDETRNVNWARRLEDAGCHVIYGILGLKTHAKALLIVRREGNRIRRYVHLATGNYNDSTARLYSDIGLMTCDVDLTNDVAAFFNLLTGYSEVVGWKKLIVAPMGLRKKFLELIDREIQASTTEKPGLIMAKSNSLQDQAIIQALYRASRAGVKVLLNIRGICCLRPGIKKVSQNIEVISIVDRYLEHARIFYFANGGHEEVYISSADWMGRNLDRRLELMMPVIDSNHKEYLIDMLKTFFRDNVNAHRLNSDGSYERVTTQGKAIRAQQQLYKKTVEAVQSIEKTALRFRPMTHAGTKRVSTRKPK
ncbi:MAG: polyphosphate kinase 1 [Sedimentisphaerales bacterium]|nr:polyphosphate kinase 1 [Sedimentisphaerales bacterium]